jgi:hypothetical protein
MAHLSLKCEGGNVPRQTLASTTRALGTQVHLLLCAYSRQLVEDTWSGFCIGRKDRGGEGRASVSRVWTL